MVAVGVLAAAGGLALAYSATTAPSPEAVMLKQAHDLAAEAALYSRWAAVLAGLALVTGIWVGYSMRTLARNEVAIAQLIEELKSR
jgi:hypothetical protein